MRCIPGPGELCQGQLFSGGASIDNGETFIPEVNAGGFVYIGGSLCPKQIHVGLSADIYVAFEVGPTIYFLNNSNELIIYESNNLTPYQFNVTLTEAIALNLFSGVIGEAIAGVNLYVAYVVDDEFHLDAQPIHFSVNPATSIRALSVFPEQDSVISSSNGEIAIHFDRALDVGRR